MCKSQQRYADPMAEESQTLPIISAETVLGLSFHGQAAACRPYQVQGQARDGFIMTQFTVTS